MYKILLFRGKITVICEKKFKLSYYQSWFWLWHVHNNMFSTIVFSDPRLNKWLLLWVDNFWSISMINLVLKKLNRFLGIRLAVWHWFCLTLFAILWFSSLLQPFFLNNLVLLYRGIIHPIIMRYRNPKVAIGWVFVFNYCKSYKILLYLRTILASVWFLTIPHIS